MNIGINAVNQPQGGSLANLRQLFREWQRGGLLNSDQLTVFASKVAAGRLTDSLPPEARLIAVPAADSGLTGRLFAEQVRLPTLLREHQIDVLFCPGNTMPLATTVPCVTTFQNAAPFCGLRNVSPALRLRWLVLGTLMRGSAWRSRRVIFLSRYFLELFVNRFGFDRNRANVIYRSGFLTDIPKTGSPRRDEVVSISHFYPYKNIVELVEGFLAARRARNAPWVLLLAGGEFVDDYGNQIRERLRSLGADDAEVRILGDVSPPEVAHLLERCGIFAFSSVCENCPTALVEALRAGAPIASSNLGVMPEIAGEAAEYFDPYSAADIERALGMLMDQPGRRAELAQAALARAGRFPTAAQSASETLAIIRTAATAPRR
jgi:glycosyltransferase involved in cell wall biosynthesis